MVSAHHLMAHHVTCGLFTLLMQCNRTRLLSSGSLRSGNEAAFPLIHGDVNHGQIPPYRLLAGIHCTSIDLLDHLSLNQSMLYLRMSVISNDENCVGLLACHNVHVACSVTCLITTMSECCNSRCNSPFHVAYGLIRFKSVYFLEEESRYLM